MTPQFLIYEPPIQVIPTLAQELGLHESIVLQQIHYWLNMDFSRCLFGDHYWVRYNPRAWGRQFAFWDERTMKRAIRNLERLGVVIIETRGPARVKYYTVDYWTLGQVVSSITWRPEDPPSRGLGPQGKFPVIHSQDREEEATDDATTPY